MDLSRLTRCQDLSEEHFAAAVASRDEAKALLAHVATIARPNEGAARILILFARLATSECDWLEGALRVDLRGGAQGVRVEVFAEIGAGLKERALPRTELAIPFEELAAAAERYAQAILPLVATLGQGQRLTLSAKEAPKVERAEPERPRDPSDVSRIAAFHLPAVRKEVAAAPIAPVDLPAVGAKRRVDTALALTVPQPRVLPPPPAHRPPRPEVEPTAPVVTAPAAPVVAETAPLPPIVREPPPAPGPHLSTAPFGMPMLAPQPPLPTPPPREDEPAPSVRTHTAPMIPDTGEPELAMDLPGPAASIATRDAGDLDSLEEIPSLDDLAAPALEAFVPAVLAPMPLEAPPVEAQPSPSAVVDEAPPTPLESLLVPDDEPGIAPRAHDPAVPRPGEVRAPSAPPPRPKRTMLAIGRLKLDVKKQAPMVAEEVVQPSKRHPAAEPSSAPPPRPIQRPPPPPAAGEKAPAPTPEPAATPGKTEELDEGWS